MARRDEAVGLRDALEPGVELAFLELDDLMAVRADEVMVVPLAAEPVAELAGAV